MEQQVQPGIRQSAPVLPESYDLPIVCKVYATGVDVLRCVDRNADALNCFAKLALACKALYEDAPFEVGCPAPGVFFRRIILSESHAFGS